MNRLNHMKGLNRWSILVIITVVFAMVALLGRGAWSTPALAGTLPGTVPSLPTDAGKLASCSIDPDLASLQPGQTQTFIYTAKDINADPLSGIIVSWSITGITAVLSTATGTTDSSGVATTDLLATLPGGTATVTATGTDTTTGQTCAPTSSATITVTSPTATPTSVPPAPTATPTVVPTPVGTPIPPVGATQEYVTPQQSATVKSSGQDVTVEVPAGALSAPAFLTVKSQTVNDVPAIPGGFQLGSRIIQVNFRDSAGNVQTGLQLNASVTITIDLTQADLDTAAAGGQIVILRYDEIISAWVELNTIVDLVNKTASVNVTRFSSFALTIKTTGLTLTLSEIGNSGQSGTAAFTAVGNQTSVIINVTAGDPSNDPQPVHIHSGSCGTGLGGVVYGLTSIVAGSSGTLVDATLASLRAGNFAVNVHKSGAEIGTYTACGNLSGAEYLTISLDELDGSGQSGEATLTAAGSQTTVIVKVTAGDPSNDPQPVHIHSGSCGTGLGGMVYGLTSIVAGESTKTVDATLASLIAGDFAINVHKSGAEIGTYTACGNITAAEVTPTPTPTATATATAVPPPTGDITPSSGLLLAMALAGLMLILGGGYYLRRSRE